VRDAGVIWNRGTIYAMAVPHRESRSLQPNATAPENSDRSRRSRVLANAGLAIDGRGTRAKSVAWAAVIVIVGRLQQKVPREL
jgi:hypothetical protein